jgi:CBS-domain-containing membrane protein
VSVEPEDPLIVAADLMVEARLHSLPVVHRAGIVRDLVGIVSQGDLLRGVQAALVEPMYAAEAAEATR